MSTETIDLIRKRFSCRDFGNRIPSDEEIEEVVQAGLHSASAVNRQPWRIIVVKDKDIIDQLETAGLAHLKAFWMQVLWRTTWCWQRSLWA